MIKGQESDEKLQMKRVNRERALKIFDDVYNETKVRIAISKAASQTNE